MSKSNYKKKLVKLDKPTCLNNNNNNNNNYYLYHSYGIMNDKDEVT